MCSSKIYLDFFIILTLWKKEKSLDCTKIIYNRRNSLVDDWLFFHRLCD